MRRMITETDVEKLDSIKPSEIQKLGAMQDPKTATAGQVLTAIAGGKAEFKAQSGGDQYAIKYKLSSGEETGTIYTDEYESYKQAYGAYISIRDVYPTESVKRVLGIVSPNFAYIKINDIYYPATEFSFKYGDRNLTVHFPKEFCTRVGITDGMKCHYKWEPALLCVIK